jgi:hypothetical protein
MSPFFYFGIVDLELPQAVWFTARLVFVASTSIIGSQLKPGARGEVEGCCALMHIRARLICARESCPQSI